jgi:hypothetical protein
MVTFIGGVQLICTGILGEYLGRVFVEVQRRPLYDVARVSRPGTPTRSTPSGVQDREDLHGS